MTHDSCYSTYRCSYQYIQPKVTTIVFSSYGVITTVGEHVVAGEALAGGGEGVRIQESAGVRIVVPALEVVQLRFGVVDIAPVAEGVVGAQGGCQGAGDGEGFAPGVIGVGNHRASRSVQDGRHIPLQVGGVVVGGAVVGHGHGNAIGVVGEVQGVAAYGHLAELAAVVDIAIGNRAVGTADSHTVLVIGIGPGGAVLGDGCQLPAMLPGVLPHAIRQGVTHGIVGNGSAVIGGKQVTPFRIPIGIGDGLGGGSQASGGVGVLLPVQDIAGAVILPGAGGSGFLVILPYQLVGGIIDIGGGMGTVADRGDVAVIIVAVGVGDLIARSRGLEGGYLGGGFGGALGAEGKGVCQQCRAALLGNPLIHPTEAVIGIGSAGTVSGDAGYPIVVVIGVRSGVLDAVDGFHQGGKVIDFVVGISHTMGVVASCFHGLHQTVGEVVVVGGGSSCGRILYLCKGTAVVIGEGDGVSVLEGLRGHPAQLVVSIFYIIIIAIVKSFQVMISGSIAVRGQGTAADADAAAQGKVAVGQAVGRGVCGYTGKHIILIGVLYRLGKAGIRLGCGGGHPVHGIVGVFRPGSGGILRVLHPFQRIGIGVIAVSGGFACGIGGGGQPVTVGGIGGCGGDLLGAAADGHGGVVAVGIVGEGIHDACIGGGGFYIVVIVIGVGELCACGENGLGQVVVGVLIFGGLPLQVLHADDIAVLVIGIAVSKNFLIQLNAVKIHGVDIVAVKDLNGDGAICLFRYHRRCRILPVYGFVRIGIEIHPLGLGFGAVGVVENCLQAELPGEHGVAGERRCIALGPASQDKGVSCLAADLYGLLQIFPVKRLALNPQDIFVQLRSGGGTGGNDFVVGCAGIAVNGPVVCRRTAIAEIAVFNQVVPAGGGGKFQLDAVYVGGAGCLGQQLGRDCGGGGGGEGNLQPCPVGIGVQHLAGDGGRPALQCQVCSSCAGFYIGGESNRLIGRDGNLSAADTAGCSGRCPGHGKGFASVEGGAGGNGSCHGGIYRSPQGSVFKAAVFQGVAHGVLELGGQPELVALCGGGLILGIPGVGGMPLSVLDADGIAPVVELHDLQVSVHIPEGGLVAGVLDGQLAAADAVVAVCNLHHPAGLVPVGGGVYLVIGVAYLVSVHILGRGEEVTGVGIGAGFSVLVGDGGQISVGICEGDIGQLRGAGAGILDSAEGSVGGIHKGVFPSHTVGNTADFQTGGGGVGDGNGTLGGLIVCELLQTAAGVEIALAAILGGDTVFAVTAAGGGQCQLQTVLVLIGSGGCVFEIVLCSVSILPDVVRGIRGPLVNPLIEIGSPAVPHGKLLFWQSLALYTWVMETGIRLPPKPRSLRVQTRFPV